MKKMNKFLNKIIILLALCLIIGGIVGCNNKQEPKEMEYTNLFEYMFSIEDGEEYMYTPQGLVYGMSMEEVIEAEKLAEYEEFHGSLISKITVTNVPYDIQKLTIEKQYVFEQGYGLRQVNYGFVVSEDDIDAFLEIVKEQSGEYMTTAINDGLSAVTWGDMISYELAKDINSEWMTIEVPKTFAAFVGVHDSEDGIGKNVNFSVGNATDSWREYNLFYDNFFSYAVNLEDEEYTYDFSQINMFQYGDDMQSVVHSQSLHRNNMVQEENKICISLAFRNMPSEIKEYAISRNFLFDGESKLTGVEYTLSVKKEEFAKLCQMLCEQAGDYMPKAIVGETKDIENGKDVSWSAEDANGKTTSYVELTFADAEDDRKEVTLGIYIEERE